MALKDLPQLDITDDAAALAGALVRSLALPAKAATDAAHIALAAVHGMHFLLTWNCTHIANAEMAVAIARVCRRAIVPGVSARKTFSRRGAMEKAEGRMRSVSRVTPTPNLQL